MRVKPYILAGGRSSRMGRDKAMLSLGGRTLLGRAVDTLRAVPSLRTSDERVTITLVGDRTELEGADNVIADRYPGCGPLGGMEAALRDLRDGDGDSKEHRNCEWAFFLPVDMPFLPVGLIEALLREWMEAGRQGAKVCYAVVEGNPQPLVSMVHRSLQPLLDKALTAGQFKVTPVLQSAAEVLSSCITDGIGYRQSALYKTTVRLQGTAPLVSGWNSSEQQEALKHLWFANLNHEEEFREAETFVWLLGSSGQKTGRD